MLENYLHMANMRAHLEPRALTGFPLPLVSTRPTQYLYLLDPGSDFLLLLAAN